MWLFGGSDRYVGICDNLHGTTGDGPRSDDHVRSCPEPSLGLCGQMAVRVLEGQAPACLVDYFLQGMFK